MIIPLNLGDDSYDIVLERGALGKAAEYLNLNRRALIVTDSGVPKEYAEKVKAFDENGNNMILKGFDIDKALEL